MSHYVFFKMVIKSLRMEMVKIVRYVRCGIMSSGGMCQGKPKSVGNRSAAAGRVKIRFDW